MDFVCPISLAIAFLAALPWGRKPWWLVDAAANFTFGLGMLFIPEYIIGFQLTAPLDTVHIHLCRVVGTILLGSAVSFYTSRNSVDYRMFGCQFFARVITCTFLLIAQLYSAYHLWNRAGIHFNDKYLTFSCIGVAFWLLGSLFQLVRYREYGGYIHKVNWLHVGLLIDAYLLHVFAILYFAFPSQALKMMLSSKIKIDGVHVCLLRTLAALLLGQAWTSNAAQGFLYMDDKRAHILGRLLVQGLAFGVNIYTHFVYKVFTIYHVTPFMFSGFYVTFLLSLYFRASNKEKEN